VGQMAAGRAPAGRAAGRLLQALLEVFGSRPVGGAAGVFTDRPVTHNMSTCSAVTATKERGLVPVEELETGGAVMHRL